MCLIVCNRFFFLVFSLLSIFYFIAFHSVLETAFLYSTMQLYHCFILTYTDLCLLFFCVFAVYYDDDDDDDEVTQGHS